MKKTLHKILAAVLAAALLATLVSAGTLGTYARQDAIELSDTAQLSRGQIYNASVTGTKQAENIVEYQPESGLRPIVAYGTTLYGRSDIDYVASYVRTTGLTPVAGINAGFFTMATGVPMGLVLTEGVVRSSGNGQTVGFRDDGTAIIGRPGLDVQVVYPDGSSASALYNKTISKSNGTILYSNDFDTKTKNTISAYNVVLSSDSDELIPGKSITAQVTAIVKDTASCDIPSGSLVLSMATETDYAYTFAHQIGTLQVGDTLTINCTISEAWADVTYAVGGDELLVENGTANKDFQLDSAKRRAARTAVGLKKDGTLVLYAIDGGQSGYSAGLTLQELAARMEELGCETALNLDGGGSTTLSAQYPGDSALTNVNQPSDGKLRKCANFIFLARETRSAGQAAHLHLYPYDAAVLTGADLSFSVKATDEDYFAASLPGSLSYTASGGDVSDSGVFTAGQEAGTATVQVSGGSASGARSVRVVADPSSVTVKNEATSAAVTSLTVAAGKSVDLTASAAYLGYTLVSQDDCYTWSVDSSLGAIDANGKFTAAALTSSATGTITCKAGTKTVSVPLTVTPQVPEGGAVHGFESGETAAVSGAGLTVTANENLSYVRYGLSSLKAAYDLSQSGGTGGKRQVSAGLDVELPDGTDTVGLWVYGDNSGNSLSLVLKTGETTASKWVTQLSFSGWKYVTAAVPAGTTAVTGFAVTEYGETVTLTGSIYLDQIIAAKGALDDAVPPTISAVQSGDGLKITAADSGSGLDSVTVSLDGAAQKSVAFAGGVGVLQLPVDGAAHQVKVTASDRCGNLSSKTVTIAGTLDAPFADVTGHWAADVINYCNREGIFTGSSNAAGELLFRPNDSMTRQEFTVALIRFLGVDPADYAAVQLPFADSGRIGAWAQDAMRAAYALGLFTGSGSNGQLCANPTATITRQEAMAILGRTQEKGYLEDTLSGFSDAASVASWARDHIAAMVSRGVIGGSNGRLNPAGTVTRAQVAKMLYSLY